MFNNPFSNSQVTTSASSILGFFKADPYGASFASQLATIFTTPEDRYNERIFGTIPKEVFVRASSTVAFNLGAYLLTTTTGMSPSIASIVSGIAVSGILEYFKQNDPEHNQQNILQRYARR